jgi:hypothetical protein
MRQCLQCARSLAGYRRQARYCSGACRAGASRDRAAERDQNASDALDAIEATFPTASRETAQDAQREPQKGAPLCPYPQHRASDWLADGGRIVRGVCHPPAPDTALRRASE